MKNKGFTTLELIIAVGVVGVIATLASSAYNYYIPKGQSTEAMVLANNAQIVALGNVKQAKCAVGDVNKDHFTGKYGQAQIGGVFKVSSGSSCPSGCTIEYKFNSSGVTGDLKDKVLVLDLLNDGRISKNLTKTTLDEKYLPRGLVNISSPDSCTALTPTIAVKTEGSVSGTEAGDADSTPPAATTPPTGGTTPPAATTPPTGGTTPPSTGSDPGSGPGATVTPPVVVDNTGKPYGYSYRWNESNMGGYMPMLEIGCVFQTNDPSVVRFAFPAYGYPTNIDRIESGIAMVTNPNYKNEASRMCMDIYNDISSNFSSLPSMAVASLPSDRRFAAFIKF